MTAGRAGAQAGVAPRRTRLEGVSDEGTPATVEVAAEEEPLEVEPP
jgi:hypothetical protein